MALKKQSKNIFEEKENCSEAESTIRDFQRLKLKSGQKNADLRKQVLKFYSQLHHKYSMKIYSLILAIHLFDNCQIDQEEEIFTVLACFMIAAKYEEIYPPRLGDVVSCLVKFFKTSFQICYKSYLKLQVKILEKFNFMINIDYPQMYIFKEKQSPFSQRMADLYTELALFNREIWDYGVEVVGKGIRSAMSSEQQEVNEELVEEVGKQLYFELHFCENSHLKHKYSDILKKKNSVI